MNDKKFKVTLSEDELKAVINHNLVRHADKIEDGSANTEMSARIHDLTKRLTRPEAEPEDKTEEKKAEAPPAQAAPAAWQ